MLGEEDGGGPVLIVIDGRKRRFYAQLRAAVAKNGGETQDKVSRDSSKHLRTVQNYIQ